jgi:hypothetical protein
MGTNTEGIQAATKSPVISVGQYSYRRHCTETLRSCFAAAEGAT